ncbi:tRNA1(Val) (adenine(37)-N6)-methyltransferase [Hansschlegelia plantiphila]|uniref:Methyltransferase n=1 Tax=Hansschlegelia plantiphila TaxID=374655 RepID=A0A9W6MVA3_9HYPH|nr:methyltransferase [Hansschlegelia plantiphila]GLK67676.1 methyltransferase [Hansschlegelia plantiphila]
MTADLTDDLFFGGRLRLLQPRRGHRAGSDAALLIAAARSRLGEGLSVADLGAATGAVGLSLALAGAGRVALIEIDPGLAVVAEENVARNGLRDRVVVAACDVAAAGARSGPPSIAAGAFGLVVANPPFDAVVRFRASPDPAKALAHAAPETLIDDWSKAAARLLKPGGSLVMIHRPEALDRLLRAVGPRFGDVRVLPIHRDAASPASRILIAARKGRRGALALLPGLVLHGEDGAFTPRADAAQRGDVVLAMG